jgi:ribosomal protein S16
MKNYPHQVIRLRKGKPGISQVYWLVVILNTKKASSHKIVERLGFFRHGPSSLLSIDYQRLSYHLNKGVILKKSVKRFIH